MHIALWQDRVQKAAAVCLTSGKSDISGSEQEHKPLNHLVSDQSKDTGEEHVTQGAKRNYFYHVQL